MEWYTQSFTYEYWQVMALVYICLFCLHLILNILISKINDTLFCVLIPKFVVDVHGPSF